MGLFNISSALNNTVIDAHSDESEWEGFKAIKLTIAFIVTTLIIGNNVVNLIVLRLMRDIGKRMKILLYSLSISDICLGITVCLPALPSGALGYWPFSETACQVSGTMNGVAIGVSLWSLTAISIERFVLIKKPHISRKNQGVVYMAFGVAAIWLVSIVFFALPIFMKEDFKYYVYDNDVISCSFKWEYTPYFMVAKVMYPVMSGSIILYSSIKIHAKIEKVQKARQSWMASVHTNLQVPSRGLPSNDSTSTRRCRHESRKGNKTISRVSPRHLTLSSSDGVDVGELRRNDKDGISGTSHTSRVKDATSNSEIIMSLSTINRNVKARLLLMCTSLLFFTTTAPYMLSSLVDHFLTVHQMPPGVKFAALWMLNTNSFVNVYVYSFIYSEFRQHCRQLFQTIFCQRKKHSVKRRDKFQGFMKKSDGQESNTDRQSDLKGNSSSVNCVEKDQLRYPKPQDIGVLEWKDSKNRGRSPRLLPRDDAFRSLGQRSSNNNICMIPFVRDNNMTLTPSRTVCPAHLDVLPAVEV